MMKKHYIIYVLVGLVSAISVSCEKLMNVETPDDVVTFDQALNTTDDMQSLLNSCYDVMANAYYGNQQNLSELLSDNLDAPYINDDYSEVYIFSTLFFNGTIGSFYSEPYISIQRINTILENFDRIQDLNDENRKRFEAEARFLRAVNHYEELQLFAQPYGYTSDNSHPGIAKMDKLSFETKARSSVGEMYNFIIEDLTFALNNLENSNVLNGVPYVDKWAAKAMLARVYFQMNDFEKASEYASDVIDSGPFTLDSLNVRWSEAISTENIFTLIINLSDGRSSSLISNYRSDNNDLPTLRATRDYYEDLYVDGPLATPTDKRTEWFAIKNAGTPDYFYAISRFDKDVFNIPFLNLTETMLIRAESNAELNGNLFAAISDLNKIKARAGIALLNENSSADIIRTHARLERRKEMIGEGRYAYDLKRRGALGEDISIRNAPWNCNGMILQFPISENTSNFEMNLTGGCN